MLSFKSCVCCVEYFLPYFLRILHAQARERLFNMNRSSSNQMRGCKARSCYWHHAQPETTRRLQRCDLEERIVADQEQLKRLQRGYVRTLITYSIRTMRATHSFLFFGFLLFSASYVSCSSVRCTWDVDFQAVSVSEILPNAPPPPVEMTRINQYISIYFTLSSPSRRMQVLL